MTNAEKSSVNAAFGPTPLFLQRLIYAFSSFAVAEFPLERPEPNARPETGLSGEGVKARVRDIGLHGLMSGAWRLS